MSFIQSDVGRKKCRQSHSRTFLESSSRHTKLDVNLCRRLAGGFTSAAQWLPLDITPKNSNDVMAANSAGKAINTQDITEKARRDLLRLLEAVSKLFPLSTLNPHRKTDSIVRFEARKIWL